MLCAHIVVLCVYVVVLCAHIAGLCVDIVVLCVFLFMDVVLFVVLCAVILSAVLYIHTYICFRYLLCVYIGNISLKHFK